jgi:uncharacterized protein (UPF0179 family)
MAETKTKVTLVGTVLAKQGVEFIYEGEIAACDSCKVKTASSLCGQRITSVPSISTGRPQSR